MATTGAFRERRRRRARGRWSNVATAALFVALAAGIFGFSGGSGAAAWVARGLFFGFLALFVVMLLVGRWSGRSEGGRG